MITTVSLINICHHIEFQKLFFSWWGLLRSAPLTIFKYAIQYYWLQLPCFTLHSWPSQVALVEKNLPADAGDKRHRFDPWVRKIPWRKAWQPTPVFLSRESHGQRSLVGYSPWGHKETDMTEVTYHTCSHIISLWVTYFITGSLYLFTARGLPLTPAPAAPRPLLWQPVCSLYLWAFFFFPSCIICFVFKILLVV